MLKKTPRRIWEIWKYNDDELGVKVMTGTSIYNLNKVGSLIWELANGKYTIRHIIKLISKRYSGVEEEIIQDDVLAFLKRAHDEGLINIAYKRLT